VSTYEIQVIDASYSIEGDLAVIELFGKTKEGVSVSVRYEDFHPYFCMLKKEKMLDILKQDIKDEIISVETIERLYRGEKTEFYKITIKTPPLIKKIRERYSGRILLTSADILYALRFYYDFDLGLCIRVSGEKIDHEEYSTDVVLKATEVEPISDEDTFTVPYTIMSFDIECSIKEDTLLTIAAIVKKDNELIERIFVGDEDYIIREFERFVIDTDPDIITGWNIDNYDIPQILKRADENKIAHPLLSRNKHPLRQHSRFWRATGRVIADGWWQTKLIKRPKKETLNAVAQQILGKKKLEIEAKNIDHHWATEREKVMKYCLNDARLALEILIEIKAIDKGFNIGAISKLPLGFALENRTSQLIDSLVIREADREGYAIPCTQPKKDNEEKIEGAYVHQMKPGIQKWVCVLDFKSLYPSIIIKNNLCFSTYSNKGTIQTPIGAKFLSPEIKRGIVPRIMNELIEKRGRIKKLLKKSKTPQEKDFYDGLQYAVKVLANAHYGIFTSSFYRFTNKEIGASITAYGRELTKSIIEKLTEEGYEIIGADTDSAFILSPFNNLEDSIKFGEEISRRFTLSGYTLEFEKIFESFFSHGAKKRYVGKLAWPEEEIFVRGYEMRRTDAFDTQSETLEKVFNLLLEGKPEEAMNYAREVITDIQNGNIAVAKLVISKTCRPFELYKFPERMPNVQTAQKLIAMGYTFTPGSKVSWIVTDSNTTPSEVEPYLDGVPFHFTPDWEYYAERVAKTVARATEAFGWDFAFLIAGRAQDTLKITGTIHARTKKPKKRKKKSKDLSKTQQLLDI